MKFFFGDLYKCLYWLVGWFGITLVVICVPLALIGGDLLGRVHLQLMLIIYALGGMFTFAVMMTHYYRECRGIPGLYNYRAYLKHYGVGDTASALWKAISWPFQWILLDLELEHAGTRLHEVFRSVIITWYTGSRRLIPRYR